VSEFADLRFLKRLDILDREWTETFKADLFPAFVDRSTPALYGIQPEANVSVIWYRKDWFEREEQAPPQTWDELVLTAKHFKRFVEFPLAFVASCRAGETTTYQLLPFLWSTGGCLFSDGKVALGEQTIIAIEFLVSLVHKYRVASPEVVSYAWDRPARLFAKGNAALAVGGSYEKPLIQEESGWDDETFRNRVGCIPVPAGPGGAQATVAGGMAYVIFRQSKDAKLALDILKRVVSPPLMREFCTKTGRSPTRVSVVETLDTEQGWFSRRVSQFLHSARTRSSIPEYARVSKQIQLMMESAISGRVLPQEAVEKTREILQAVISHEN
jgi:ABC-type glycerol-3-phosphate transport system substrate-binding protein